MRPPRYTAEERERLQQGHTWVFRAYQAYSMGVAVFCDYKLQFIIAMLDDPSHRMSRKQYAYAESLAAEADRAWLKCLPEPEDAPPPLVATKAKSGTRLDIAALIASIRPKSPAT